MTPERRLKFQNLGLIVLISTLYGLLYNYLYYPHTFVEFLEAGSIGVFVGLFIGSLEGFVLAPFFRTKSFRSVTAIRVVIYSTIISLLLAVVLAIEEAAIQEIPYADAFVQYLQTYEFRRDFAYTLFFILSVLFLIELFSFVGQRRFFRLLLGKYHQPKEVERIFAFIDLKDSTVIAEKLPHVQYSELMRDYFNDLSDAILLYDGEIYQFVGDEVVVSWPINSKRPKCIDCFFKMKEIIHERSANYQHKYGLVPQFKAGIHAGVVITTVVGKHKKEIVYHGDVLNTTARIQGRCNDLGQELLLSKDMLNYLDIGDQYLASEIGEISLKGKASKMGLIGITIKKRAD